MANRALSTLLEGGSFFESPRWRDGRWQVSDFYTEIYVSRLMAELPGTAGWG